MRKLRMTKTGYDTSISGGHLFFENAHQCPVDSPQFAEIVGDGYTNTIRLESLSVNWYEREWMSEIGFVNYDINVQMTLRREVRSGRGYWYAYRRVLGKLHKRYVGQDEELTEKRLLTVAQKMPSVG
jgi:hypothetical protein